MSKKRRMSCRILATHKINGDTTVYNSVEEAASDTGISRSIIYSAIHDPTHYSHNKQTSNDYVIRDGKPATRVRMKYVPFDFQPAYTDVVRCHNVHNKEEVLSFSSHSRCIEAMGFSRSSYYKVFRGTKFGHFSTPLKCKYGKFWIMDYMKELGSVPSQFSKVAVSPLVSVRELTSNLNDGFAEYATIEAAKKLPDSVVTEILKPDEPEPVLFDDDSDWA